MRVNAKNINYRIDCLHQESCVEPSRWLWHYRSYLSWKLHNRSYRPRSESLFRSYRGQTRQLYYSIKYRLFTLDDCCNAYSFQEKVFFRTTILEYLKTKKEESTIAKLFWRLRKLPIRSVVLMCRYPRIDLIWTRTLMAVAQYCVIKHSHIVKISQESCSRCKINATVETHMIRVNQQIFCTF